MILQGDALEQMRTLEDNSVDTVITDPPYGYSFMGKSWDKAVPSVDIWKECLRVLKPGGWCMVMSAPRSDVQNAMISRLMEAGFRLDFTPIYWTYASGFPKAGNVGKLVDKRLGAEREVIGIDKSAVRVNSVKNHQEGQSANLGLKAEGTGVITTPATDQAKALDGSYTGFQPKPAVEVVIVAMKPLSEKTYVDQALKNGKGITWLDDCRVPSDEPMKAQTMPDLRDVGRQSKEKIGIDKLSFNQGIVAERLEYTPNTSGRFPANLLVSDDVLNDGVDRKGATSNSVKNTGIFNWGNQEKTPGYADNGSYSRYFDLDKWAAAHLPEQQMQTFPFAIFPKASKSEKNKGLEHLDEKLAGGMSGTRDGSMLTGSGNVRNNMAKNHHPTVKPLKLMSYIITLTTRPGDTVLDPFVGSGTTVVAAKQLNRKGIGIEREPEYAEIAQARYDAEKYQPKPVQTSLV